MERFIEKHQAQITGVVGRSQKPEARSQFGNGRSSNAGRWPPASGLYRRQPGKEFKAFTSAQSESIKAHAQAFAAEAGRPYEYLNHHVRKEEYVRSIAKRDGVSHGLICVLAINEENHSFALRYGNERPRLTKCSPRCLTLYFYFLDPHFGFMHIRLSTWMPFSIQVYVNGHEWLAREMTAKHMAFEQKENAFVWIDDSKRAQKMADQLPTLPWEKILHAFARRVNPLLRGSLKAMEYYWVIDQAEFRSQKPEARGQFGNGRRSSAGFWLLASGLFLPMGRKLHGSFNSTIVTDVKARPTVTRIKHTVRGNWIKMYNKNGIVLRVETVINRPAEFRVFRLSRGKHAGYYEPLRKRISDQRPEARSRRPFRTIRYVFFRIFPLVSGLWSLASSSCEPTKKGKTQYRPLNPLRKNDRLLFEAVVRGEHHIHGFKACEIAHRIGFAFPKEKAERKRQSACIYRKLRLLRGHGLIARCARSKRYRVTDFGMRYMNAAIMLHSEAFQEVLSMLH